MMAPPASPSITPNTISIPAPSACSRLTKGGRGGVGCVMGRHGEGEGGAGQRCHYIRLTSSREMMEPPARPSVMPSIITIPTPSACSWPTRVWDGGCGTEVSLYQVDEQQGDDGAPCQAQRHAKRHHHPCSLCLLQIHGPERDTAQHCQRTSS